MVRITSTLHTEDFFFSQGTTRFFKLLFLQVIYYFVPHDSLRNSKQDLKIYAKADVEEVKIWKGNLMLKKLRYQEVINEFSLNLVRISVITPRYLSFFNIKFLNETCRTK